jgi:hypothetical protein
VLNYENSGVRRLLILRYLAESVILNDRFGHYERNCRGRLLQPDDFSGLAGQKEKPANAGLSDTQN